MIGDPMLLSKHGKELDDNKQTQVIPSASHWTRVLSGFGDYKKDAPSACSITSWNFALKAIHANNAPTGA